MVKKLVAKKPAVKKVKTKAAKIVPVKETFWAYLLECADGTFYAGSTNDLEKRLHQHNHSGSGAHYTKIRRPVKLAYSEACASFSEMRKREAALKRLKRGEKESLTKGFSKGK